MTGEVNLHLREREYYDTQRTRKRKDFENWVFAPFFEKLVLGMFVRIRVSSSNKESHFEVGRVVGKMQLMS